MTTTLDELAERLATPAELAERLATPAELAELAGSREPATAGAR